jgi:hypothetical protein
MDGVERMTEEEKRFEGRVDLARKTACGIAEKNAENWVAVMLDGQGFLICYNAETLKKLGVALQVIGAGKEYTLLDLLERVDGAWESRVASILLEES